MRFIATSGGPLATRERALVPTASRSPPRPMDLPELLEPERIRCRCDIHSKKRALQTLAELLGAALRRAEDRSGEQDDATGTAADGAAEMSEVSDMDILDALISRERLGSTGLGHGVALPHSRLDVVDAPLAALITLNDGVDFQSGDGEPVDLVLGLLVPRDCNDEHLQILAKLARRFSDAEFRDALRAHASGEELFAHLQRLAAAS